MNLLSWPPESSVAPKESPRGAVASYRELIHQLQQENRALRQELDRLSSYRRLAYRDDLTNLFNRRCFDERLTQELSRAGRHDQPLALVVVDLDGFKRINDTCGHASGDYVLRFFGRLMAEVCREYDIPCRLGGDEFAYILPETDEAGAHVLMQRLARAIAEADDAPVLPAGMEVRFSYGVAERTATSRPGDLVASADASMYGQKWVRHAGRSAAA